MTRLILALVVISFVGLSTGCGQKGPLYLPGNPSKIEKIPPAAQDAEEEETKNKDGDSGSS
ncbi:MAG: hypothetical protein KJO46_05415 [Gammaproteobacteria bacterium]|nr:hypothetical protein [Gammaproteobacteria bacterium]